MQDQPAVRRANRPGESALALGVIAIAGLFVPIVGDFVTAPAAVAAMVLGFVGMRRHETGRATGSASAIAGVIVGALAITGLLMMLAATRLPT
jgi:hypothetical protein